MCKSAVFVQTAWINLVVKVLYSFLAQSAGELQSGGKIAQNHIFNAGFKNISQIWDTAYWQGTFFDAYHAEGLVSLGGLA